jgi:hypothetical protein
MSDDPQLVVELHVPLTPTPGLGEDEYQFPWIDQIMDEVLALDDAGVASTLVDAPPVPRPNYP